MPEAEGEGGQSVGRPFFNALGPRATSGARPTAGAQPEFTSGVKRSRRRASSAGRTACLAQTGLRVLRDTARSEIIPPAPPWFCLPASPVRRGGGEREDYGQKEGRRGRKSRKAASQRSGERGRLEECSRRLRTPGGLAGAVRSADAVQVCAAAPTCGGRLLSGLRRAVVSKEAISRAFYWFFILGIYESEQVSVELWEIALFCTCGDMLPIPPLFIPQN